MDIWWVIYQYSWNTCPFIKDSICSCMMWHHLIFSALSNNVRTRLRWTVMGFGRPVNWHARLPDFNSLDFLLWGSVKPFVYSAPINDFEVLQQQAENACQKWVPGIFLGVKDWRRIWLTASPPSVSRMSGKCGSLHVSHSYVSPGTLTGRALIFTRTIRQTAHLCAPRSWK
jgi:hypothetical protein